MNSNYKLNGVSPHAFQNYFTRVNHRQGTRANTKNIVLPKSNLKQERRPFPFKGQNFQSTDGGNEDRNFNLAI